MSRFCAFVSVLVGLAMLGGCSRDDESLQVGGKQSPEYQIVGELVAELAEEAGIPVERRIGLGDSRLTLEALKRGEIDIYAESTGSGLALLGLAESASADPDASIRLLRERYASLGLEWSDPVGFESSPVLVMLRDRARPLRIRSYSDLSEQADDLVVGVDSEFRRRPVDGLAPLSLRYGLQFERVVEVEARNRVELFGRLLDGEIDVALVRSGDPEIPLFDLLELRDDLDFFAGGEVALLYRLAALQRFPALEGVMEQLADAINNEQIRALSRRVSIRGEDPREVVRDELIRRGLIDGEVGKRDRQAVSLAVSPSANADGEAGALLRQLRRSFPTSNVNLVRSGDPLGAVKDGSVRLALVSAPAFFAPGSIDPDLGQPPLRPGIEAVALVGTSYLQAFALNPQIERLEQASLIAAGPEGSSGFRAAQSLIDGLQLSATLVSVEGDRPETLADALINSGADVAVLMQPIGNSTALTMMRRGLSLIEVDGWIQRNNRIVFPYLQPARLSPADLAPFLSGDSEGSELATGFSRPIETLATQLVLAGPAPAGEARLSTQGPGASFDTRPLPLTDQTVERINAVTAGTEDIYPILPQARALAPRLPQPPQSLNPSPAASGLSVLAILLLIWTAWLLLRPTPVGRE
ncbi:glycine betaine ABC transporter substrate-binding protein [Wenzhouxiangella limi]|uniref:ABC-type glycine betaine transport system substrate-binding domain-containing protein n=1 Tax=Wenzhouxiangella limi TaxID=2707351 RepID=A0A845V017_9GAMM|nr:hypothetical protein [Wenzhouxiangella limi]